ncbi:MAG: flavodoxin family protein [Spirochaetota bacterium]
MNVRIVYDSVFGNTKQIASAIQEAMGEDVVLLKADKTPTDGLKDFDILILGSPTRAFTATKTVKQFLKSIPKGALTGVTIAAFDTRIDPAEANSRLFSFLVKIFGYAADSLADQLIRKGGTQAVVPEGFFVNDSEGPLRSGETERAAAWAHQILGKGTIT